MTTESKWKKRRTLFIRSTKIKLNFKEKSNESNVHSGCKIHYYVVYLAAWMHISVH